MVERRDRVPAPGHRNQASICGQRRRDLRKRHRRRVERFGLERTQRPVPDQGPAILQRIAERLDRGRSDVEDHLVGPNLVDIAGPQRGRIGRKFGRDNDVIGQVDRASGLFRAPEDRLGLAGQFMLAKRLADIDPAPREEGVGHSPANDQMIDLVDQVAKHRKLARHLGSPDHRRDRPLGIAERRFECLQFGFHRAAGKTRQQMRDPLGRGMSPMRGRKGIVDIIVAKRRNRLGKSGIVRLFARVKAGVLEHADRPGGHRGHRPLGIGSGTILDEPHRAPGKIAQRPDQQRGRHIGSALPLGPPEMAEQKDDRPAITELQHGRKQCLEPGRIAHRPVLHRHVQVHPDEHALALKIGWKVVEGLEAGQGLSFAQTGQPNFAIALAVSTMRLEKPHSLSYQLTTRTSLPSSTAVSRLSTVELAGLPFRSIETSGSSV